MFDSCDLRLAGSCNVPNKYLILLLASYLVNQLVLYTKVTCVWHHEQVCVALSFLKRCRSPRKAPGISESIALLFRARIIPH
jgi:hypothetical protein